MVELIVPHQILFGKKKKAEEPKSPRAWEHRNDWSNPFGGGSVASAKQEESRREGARRQRKRDKKKRRKSRRHMTPEERSEMESQADSLLDELLGEPGAAKNKTMAKVMEESGELVEGEYLESDRAINGGNPFEDESEAKEKFGDEIDQQGFKQLLEGKPSQDEKEETKSNPNTDSVGEKQNNPFEDNEDDQLSVNAPILRDDDSSLEPPEQTRKARTNQNPFEDDSVANSEHIGHNNKESDNESSKEASEEDDSEAEDITEEEKVVEEEDDEDLVESSKRLLRMADKRLKYQQHNDQVKVLREQIDQMKVQGEAMSEQLRRAIETKCDLVLAQTEMEKSHEQDLMVKDTQIKELDIYSKRLLEQQSLNDLNFLNELSKLSTQVTEMQEAHKKELLDKDHKIAQLEMRLQSMKTESVRGNSSRNAFKSRFMENQISDVTLGDSIDEKRQTTSPLRV